MSVMSDNELLTSIKELLEIETDIVLESDFNPYDYDSFSKINLVIFIEAYCRNRVDIDKFLDCKTFVDVIELIKTIKLNDW